MSRRTASLAVAAALVATASVGTLAACGGHHAAVVVASQPAALSYSPAAYGENGHCYYIDDPAEATAMIAAGLCPASWTPMLMPLAWHEEYYDYYASPSYYNTYVPVRYRTVWVSQQSGFYTQYRTTIVVVQKNAPYKGSDGKTVTGGSIPSAKMSFGSGVKPSVGFGSVAPPKADNASPAKPSFGGGAKAPASAAKPAPVVPR